jgi:hypothetical protein
MASVVVSGATALVSPILSLFVAVILAFGVFSVSDGDEPGVGFTGFLLAAATGIGSALTGLGALLLYLPAASTSVANAPLSRLATVYTFDDARLESTITGRGFEPGGRGSPSVTRRVQALVPSGFARGSLVPAWAACGAGGCGNANPRFGARVVGLSLDAYRSASRDALKLGVRAHDDAPILEVGDSWMELAVRRARLPLSIAVVFGAAWGVALVHALVGRTRRSSLPGAQHGR